MKLPRPFTRLWFLKALDERLAPFVTWAPPTVRAAASSDKDPDWWDEMNRALDRTYGRGPVRAEIDLALPRILRLMQVTVPHQRVREYLRQMVDLEWLAHVDLQRPWHRDHLVHPARVAMLGSWLLDEADILQHAAEVLRADWEVYATDTGVAEAHEPATWRRIARLAWLSAALYHDHCYPIELSRTVHRRVCSSFGLGGPEADRRWVGRWLAKLRGTRFAECLTSGGDPADCKHLHAPLGAVSLLTNDSFGRGHDPLWDVVLEVAALAVFRHHLERPVCFDDDPIGFLLVLCDGLQEWGRASCYYCADHLAAGDKRYDDLRPFWEDGTTAIGSVVPCAEMEAKLDALGDLTFHFSLAPEPSLERLNFDRGIPQNALDKLRGLLDPGAVFPPLGRFEILP